MFKGWLRLDVFSFTYGQATCFHGGSIFYVQTPSFCGSLFGLFWDNGAIYLDLFYKTFTLREG